MEAPFLPVPSRERPIQQPVADGRCVEVNTGHDQFSLGVLERSFKLVRRTPDGAIDRLVGLLVQGDPIA